MKAGQSRSIFITWEDAQKLRPILKRLSEEGPYSEVRKSAKALYIELGSVRKLDYSPFPGHQLLLNRYDREVIHVVMDALEE